MMTWVRRLPPVRWLSLALALLLPMLTAQRLSAYSVGELLKTQLDPTVAYQAITTPHFRIIYEPSLADLAYRLSGRVEAIRAKVLSECGCEFSERTNLVLTARSDSNTIYSSVFPHNQIFLNATLPNYSVGLNDYSRWYEWVFSHEYFHIVHLNRLNAGAELRKAAFGTWYRPNQLRAAWLKEGLAVAIESTANSKGRVGSTTYRMIGRMAALGGLFDSVDAAAELADLANMSNFEEKRWPWTIRPYVFGTELVGTLLGTAASSRHSAYDRLMQNPASYLDSHQDDAAIQSGFPDMLAAWRETIGRLKARAATEAESIRKDPLTTLEYLTEGGYYIFSPVFTPEGDALLLTRETPDGVEIQRLALSAASAADGTRAKPEMLIERTAGSQVALSRSGRFVAYDQLSRQQRYDIISDVYIYDLKEKRTVAISPGLRIQEPDIHPDGKHLVYVQNVAGRHRLVTSRTDWQESRVLIDGIDYRRLSAPRYSPSGDAIALTAHNEETGGEDLWLVGKDGAITALVEDSRFNFSPSWSADGKSLYFASDQSGVFNVYRLELESGRIDRLSNVLGGLLYPIADEKSGRIYAASYRSGGFDIAWFELPKKDRIGFSPIQAKYRRIEPIAPPTVPATEPQPYRNELELAPHFLYPTLTLRPSTIQPGVAFGSIEPLFHQLYEAELRYDSQTREPVGRIQWFRSLTSTSWLVQATRDTSAIHNLSAPRETLRTSAFAYFPLDNDQNNIHFKTGASLERIQDPETGEAYHYGPGLGLLFDFEFQPLGHLWPIRGNLLDVDLKLVRSMTGSSNSLYLNFLGTHHIPFSDTDAIHARFYGGTVLSGEEHLPSYRIGGRQSFPFSNDSELVLYGYPVNSIAAKHALVTELVHSHRYPAAHQFVSGTPLFKGSVFLNGRVQMATVRGAEGYDFIPSIGLELGRHFIAYSIRDLEAKIGVYTGDRRWSGETQLYVFIHSVQ